MEATRLCQWITSPSLTPGDCPHTVVPGASYCSDHLARMYQPSKRERQTAALAAELAGASDDTQTDEEIEA